MSAVLARLGRARADRLLLAAATGAVLLAGLTALVARSADRLGARLGGRATGALHTTMGHLPLLFVGIAALRAGLDAVLQAALVGAILGNSLLVLGVAFVVGGHRHGSQRFAARMPRLIAALTLLSVAALAVPTLARGLHSPAGAHVEALGVASALVLLLVFVVSAPVVVAGRPDALNADARGDTTRGPLAPAMAILVAAIAGTALVSGLFVDALPRATATLHLSPAFAGLVVVALAGHVTGSVIGVRLAARDQPNDAVAVILTNSLQVALGVIPALVLLSFVVGPMPLTLVWPGLLLVALGLAALLDALIVFDGASTWLEGVALIGLYGIVAVSFWWG